MAWVSPDLEPMPALAAAALDGAGTLRLVDRVGSREPEAGFGYTVTLVARMWGSAEAEEGINSFLQKRAPAWRPVPATATTA